MFEPAGRSPLRSWCAPLLVASAIGCGGATPSQVVQGNAYSTLRGDTTRTRAVSPGEMVVAAPVAAAVAANDYASQPAEDVVWGWGLVIEGGVARWSECTSETDCTTKVVRRPSRAIGGVTRVGVARAPSRAGGADEEVDVYQLRLKRDRSVSRSP